MEYEELKKIAYDANLKLVKYNLVILTWGNASVIDRKKGVIAIKPRGIDYNNLVPNDIAIVDIEGNPVDSKYLPSVDLHIHLGLYKNFSEIGSIVHTHSMFATAWAQAYRSIPVLGTTHADHFHGSIPCTRQLSEKEVNEDYEKQISNIILECLEGKNPMEVPAILIAGHGPLTWGKTSHESVENSIILEEIARIAILSISLGRNLQIPQYLIDKHYSRKFGPNSYFYQDHNIT